MVHTTNCPSVGESPHVPMFSHLLIGSSAQAQVPLSIDLEEPFFVVEAGTTDGGVGVGVASVFAIRRC